jgi:hypothetical protein
MSSDRENGLVDSPVGLTTNFQLTTLVERAERRRGDKLRSNCGADNSTIGQSFGYIRGWAALPRSW